MSDQGFGRQPAPAQPGPVAANAPFGVLTTFGSGLSALRANFPPLMALAALAALPGLIFSLLVAGGVNGLSSGISAMNVISSVGAIFTLGGIFNLLPLVIGMVAAVTLTHESLLAGAGRVPLDAGTRLRQGLSRFIPTILGFLFMAAMIGAVILFFTSFVFATGDGAVIVFGFIAVFVAILFLLSTFSVLLPAIAVERNGFGVVARAWRLSGGYRAPLFGLMALTFLFDSFVIGPIGSIIALAFTTMLSGTGVLATSLALFTQLIVVMLTFFFSVIIQTAAFVRLKVLKEGMADEDVAAVFE